MKSIPSRLPLRLSIVAMSVIFIVLLKSCEKAGFDHPVLHTGEVTDISLGGAMFHGRISEMGGVKIVDHGFVWGTVKEPNLENSIKISLGIPDNTDFQTQINHSLQKGRICYVKSFVTDSNSSTAYGRVVSFTSIGLMAPEISSIHPSSGLWGDTLTISGKNFGVSPDLVAVLIDNIEAQLIHFRLFHF